MKTAVVIVTEFRFSESMLKVSLLFCFIFYSVKENDEHYSNRHTNTLFIYMEIFTLFFKNQGVIYIYILTYTYSF